MRQRGQRGLSQEQGAHGPEVTKNAVRSGAIEVVDPRRSAGAGAPSDDPLDHPGVPLSVHHEALLDLEHRVDDLAGPGEQRQLPVALDEDECGADPTAPARFQIVPAGLVLTVQKRMGSRDFSRIARTQALHVRGEGPLPDGMLHAQLGFAGVRGQESLEKARHATGIVRIIRRRAVDGRAKEPLVQDLAQGGAVSKAAEDPVVGVRPTAAGILERLEPAALAAEVDAVRIVEAEQDLDLAKLRGLEAGGGDQPISKGQKIPSGQGLHEVEVGDALPQDGDHATQGADRAREPVVRYRRQLEQVARTRELPQHQLEPELVDLVGDDEDDLVVLDVRLVALHSALEGEQLLHPNVVPVRDGPRRHGVPASEPRPALFVPLLPPGCHLRFPAGGGLVGVAVLPGGAALATGGG